mgnify:CR=1 FL=1
MKDKIKFITSIFGTARLQNNGIELMIPCPFCKDSKKLKMNIRLDSELYHCWVCNSKGRNIGRLIKQKKPSMVGQYFEKFGNQFTYNIPLLPTDNILLELPSGFRLIMQYLSDPDALAVYNYCRSRGYTDNDLWRYRIGYTDEWKYRRRMIVPSFDHEGNLNYYSARAIDDTPYTYINAKANKRHIIFNDIDLDWTAKTIVLVEGPLDWMKCGKINAVCILGSSLSEDSLLFQKIVKNSMDVILSLDPDAYKKQLRIAALLSSYDLNISLASPLEGDIGDMNENSIEQLMLGAVEYTNELGSLPFLINNL